MPVAGDIPKRAHSNVKSWREVKNAIDVLNQRIDAAILTVEKGDVPVVSPCNVIDFSSVDFKVTHSPDGEANISLASVVGPIVPGTAGDIQVSDGSNWLSQSPKFSEIMFAATADDTVANTTVKTAFAPSGVGSAIIAANSLVVGQVIKIACRGVLSTA